MYTGICALSIDKKCLAGENVPLMKKKLPDRTAFSGRAVPGILS